MHEVYAVREEPVEEPLLDVAPVSEDLLREDLPDAVIPVVHVCACKTECHDLPTVVAQQVELEAVTPAHRAPAVGGHAPEDLVGIAAKVVAYGYHRAVDEAYTRTSAESHDFHEQHHQEEHARHELHEAVVGYGRREIRPQVLPYEERVIVLEVREGAEMVADRYCHYLALAHLSLTVPASLPVCGRQLTHGIFLISSSNFLQNSSIVQKISVILSVVIIVGVFCMVCNYLCFNYKDTKFLRDYQLFQTISYTELAYLICKFSYIERNTDILYSFFYLYLD